MELDLIRVWGDGSVVAADGTQVDTFIDNLLAETSIRYGGPAGSGPTTSPTPTSRCSPGSSRSGCGEAVYLIDGLLDQQSKARPTKIHTDTQG